MSCSEVYLKFKFSKTISSTLDLIEALARNLKIPRNRIFFAGTKDKRAVTQQLFVIDANQSKVAEVEMPDVEIEILGRTHQKIGFGNHRGNRFTIVARGCCHEDGTPMTEKEALEEVESIKVKLDESLGSNLFPNWIGPQRFGSGRPVTAEVGRHIIANRWKEAEYGPNKPFRNAEAHF